MSAFVKKFDNQREVIYKLLNKNRERIIQTEDNTKKIKTSQKMEDFLKLYKIINSRITRTVNDGTPSFKYNGNVFDDKYNSITGPLNGLNDVIKYGDSIIAEVRRMKL